VIEPDGTPVLPSSFMPAAQRFGLLPEIDRYILEGVLDTLGRYPSVRIFANLAAASFHNDAILELVQERVGSVSPGALGLEVTETAAMLDFERSAARLETYRSLGYSRSRSTTSASASRPSPS
jgi:EAL domain-containing protein (putative c-di-GMP-specific phosphodiesterase class I)